MDTFESALSVFLNTSPYATAVLASIGLATVAFLLWSAIKPLFSYLISGPRQLMSVWLYSLVVFGAGAYGYGRSDDPMKGMWIGIGVASFVFGVLTIVSYWIRQWVKWEYGET